MTRSSNSNLGVSSSKRFSMFDFNEDDELVEMASKKLLNKFVNHNDSRKRRRSSLSSSPINKYKFLECFAGCDKTREVKTTNEPIIIDDGPIDVDTEKGTKDESKEINDELVNIDAYGTCQSHKLGVSSPTPTTQEDSAAKEMHGLDVQVLCSSSNYDNDPRDTILDDDENEMTSPSTSICTLEDNEVPSTDPESECCSLGVGHKVDVLNNAVAVFPDFILYGDIYCTESRLTFSCGCIRIEGSTVNGSKGTFNAEWAIGDIVSIESDWCGRVETAMIKLLLRPNNSKGVGNANETSGIDELKFSVYDPWWSEGQEAIKSLHFRYRDIWKVNLDTDMQKDDKAFTGSNSVAIPKSHFHVLDETIEDVIYPEGDPDAVSISKRDVLLLQPETFINDTIIDFYIKFLKNKIQPEEQHRFHFFNSFFFRKLADLDKDPSNVCEGKAAFQRVRKWTKKVNLFEKDYIFIPVNYSLHWSLIVICHPGEVAKFRDEDSESALKVPCILHMDSIRGSHRGLKNLIQSYLCEEWKERHTEVLDDVSSKFSRLRFVPLELPQQENSFDCGLFLLHYVELFLQEVPINFSPFKITEFSNFLNRKWFLPQEASLKRSCIQKLICEILEDQSQKVSQVQSITKYHYHCSQFDEKDGQEIGVEFLAETSGSVKFYQADSFIANTELGIRSSLPFVSSLEVEQHQIKETRLDYRELFEPGRREMHDSQTDACRRCCMSPIKEADESVERVSDSLSDHENPSQIAGLETENAASSSGRYFESSETAWMQHYLQVKELDDNDSSSGTSSSKSQKSSEIGEEANRQKSLTSSEDPETCIVEDSQEADCSHEGNADGDFISTCKISRGEDMPVNTENLVSESDEEAT